MATTIVASRLPGSTAVALEVTTDRTTLVSLTRVDVNGTHPVRMRDGDGLVGGAGLFTDSEAALVGVVEYRVRVGAPFETASTTITLDVENTAELVPVATPSALVTLDLVIGYTARRPVSSVVHDVIGRADPLVSYGRQSTRRGTLQLWCPDYATARAVEDTAGLGLPIMLRQTWHPGLDMWFTADPAGADVDAVMETGGERWLVSYPFVELAYPRDVPLAGSITWTYGESLARNPTYEDSIDEFETYTDLLVGPVV